MILFGSHAWGNYHEESDVDFAVVLRKSGLRPSEEVFKAAAISTELELKYGLMLSTLPVSFEKKQRSQQWVYKAIREEGILI